MTTNPTLAFGFSQTPSLPKFKTATDQLAIGILTVTFLLSYVQYIFERSDGVRTVPIALMIAGAVLYLAMSPHVRRRALLCSVVRPTTLGIVAMISVPALFSSFYRADSYPAVYGIAIILTVLAARILLSGIGLEGILLAFFYATTIAIFLVVGLNFSRLVEAFGPKRFSPLSFDPNRTGFFAVTSIPAQLWFATRQKGRKYVLLASALCLAVTFATSSRGSVGALLIGGVFTVALYVLRLIKYRTMRISRNALIGSLALLCIFAAAVATKQTAFESAGRSVWNKLEMDTRDRGMDSGFTGRTNGWSTLLEVFPKTSWLTGNGYRTSDEDFSFAVDNGYLASLYELGVVATVVLVAKYLLCIYLLSMAYVGDELAAGTCLPAFIFTLVVFLSNAFVHRVLFGFGDQASLLVLFLIVVNRQDIFAAIPGNPGLFYSPRNMSAD